MNLKSLKSNKIDVLNVIIAFFLAILPALAWLVFYYKKDHKDPEPKKVILKTFVAGIVVALPFLTLRSLLPAFTELNVLLSGLLAVLLFAVLEEVAKLSASIFIVMRHKLDFNQVIDGVIYAVTAALGFAFIENILYFYEFLSGSGEQLLSVFLFRSVGTMLAHTLFSATAGLIWAYAYFSKQITPFQKKHLLAFELKDLINREILTLHIIRNNILRARPSRRGGHEKKILVFEGIVLASALHVIFNLSTGLEVMGKNLTFLLIPLIMLGLVYVSYWFTKKANIKIFKVV